MAGMVLPSYPTRVLETMPVKSFVWIKPVVFKLAKPKKPPKKRPPKPPAKKVRTLTEFSIDVIEEIVNRIHAKVEDGTIDVLYEAEDLADRIEITYGELNRIIRIIAREGFRFAGLPRPCSHPPGSAAKIAEMERRAEQGLATTSPLDADPDGDRRGVEVIGRGKGPKAEIEILGWSDE